VAASYDGRMMPEPNTLLGWRVFTPRGVSSDRSTLRGLALRVLAGFIIVAGLWFTVTPDDEGARGVQIAMAAGALAGALLSIRWPLLGVAVTCLATGIAWLNGLTADPFVLAGFGVFVIAERQGTRRFPGWMVGGVAVVAGVAVTMSAEGLEDRIRALLLSAVVLTILWVLGVRTQQVKREAAVRSRAEERLRLARDVHDVLSHSLATIGVRAGVASHVSTLSEAELRGVLHDIEEGARGSLAELGELLRQVRIGDSGAASATTLAGPLSDTLSELLESAERAGLRTTLTLSGEVDALPAAVSATVHRVVQESVTNAIRHAAATSLHVTASVRVNRVDIAVSDDGLGAVAGLQAGLGLRGMRERVELVGGILALHKHPPGFTVSVSIPLRAVAQGGAP
jgi:signal transduction histidine kinase